MTDQKAPRRVRTGNLREGITGLTQRNRLTIRGKEPGYFYYICNADLPGWLDELLERGFEVVNYPIRIGDVRVDNSNPEGSAQTVELGGPATGKVKGVVVRIKDEWREEDEQMVVDAAKQQAASTIHPSSV